jgi:hypothetical protein
METYYRPIEQITAKPQFQGNVFAEERIAACAGDDCQIEPKKIEIYDGTSGQFHLANPIANHTYNWKASFANAIESGSSFKPDAHLSTTRGTSVEVREPVWVPVPAAPKCDRSVIDAQALEGAKYKLEVSDATGLRAKSEFTVVVPWSIRRQDSLIVRGNPAAGTASNPTLVLDTPNDDWADCDAHACRPNLASLRIRRLPSIATLAPSLWHSNSVFKPKVEIHEANHVDFWENPNRCGSKYFTVEKLRQAIRACIESSECVVPVETGIEAARQRLSGILERVKNEVTLSEVDAIEHIAKLSEYYAYQADQGTGPDYILLNCGRFTEYACPR